MEGTAGGDGSTPSSNIALLLQVYPPSSGDSFSRDAIAYPSAKTPSSTYPSPFYVAGVWGSRGRGDALQGWVPRLILLLHTDSSLHPSAELWSPPGQAGFGPMLGDGSSPLPLAPGSSSVGSGAFGGLQQQERMVGAVVGGPACSAPLLNHHRAPHLLIVPSELPAAWI